WEQWDTIEAVGARRLMRGKDWPVWRIKAGLKMPNTMPELSRDKDRLIGDGPAHAKDVPAPIEGLADKDAPVPREGAEDLGKIGPAAADAVKALLKQAEQDADPVVRVTAAKAVANIDAKDRKAFPLLVEALKHKSARVRKHAAESLGDLGPGAKSA